MQIYAMSLSDEKNLTILQINKRHISGGNYKNQRTSKKSHPSDTLPFYDGSWILFFFHSIVTSLLPSSC